MKTLLVSVAVAGALTCALAAPAPAAAKPDACGLPQTKPLWIDFADGSVPFWKMFARPGVIAAASNFIFPPRLRALGAKTVYWDMYLNSRRVGTPNNPAAPADVAERAHRLFDYAAASQACPTPMIVENELFGASLPAPWTPSNAQYRANVLLYLRTLAARGAHPVLLVSSTPYLLGEAGDWWRAVAQVADLVREVYFPAAGIHQQGPLLGSRTLRTTFRRAVGEFAPLGIPTSKLGIMLGFQTTPGRGFGGRENLKPASAWFETVKLQVLAAQQVGQELALGSIWSWGWGEWSDPERDPDKPTAACVYLWTRDPTLCDVLKLAGGGFNTSLTQGQLVFPRGVTCLVEGRLIRTTDIATLTRTTGDRDIAYSALYARAVESGRASMTRDRVARAERNIIAIRFHGSQPAYQAALARAHVAQTVARGVIADELRRADLAEHLRVSAPTDAQVTDYYQLYGQQLARPVEATPPPDWLGKREQGYALASVAPEQIFSLPSGRRTTVRTLEGSVRVRATGAARPLALVSLDEARPAVVAAVTRLKRADAYEHWAVALEKKLLQRTNCRRDELPTVSGTELTDYAPFLALT